MNIYYIFAVKFFNIMNRTLSIVESRIGRLIGIIPEILLSLESPTSNSSLLNAIEKGLFLRKILRDKYSSNVQGECRISEELIEQIRDFIIESEEVFLMSCSFLKVKRGVVRMCKYETKLLFVHLRLDNSGIN